MAKRERREKENLVINRGAVDPVFVGLIAILTAVGLVMLFSASHVHSYFNMTSEVNGEIVRSSYNVIIRQLMFTGVGVVAMYIVSHITLKVYRIASYAMLIVAFGLVFFGIFSDGGGANETGRWIIIAGINFQPSEIMKIAIVLFCAAFTDRYALKLKEKPTRYFIMVAIIAIAAVLVLAQSHLSGAILIFLVGVTMLFICDMPWYWFVLLAVVLVVAIFVVVNYTDKLPINDYQKERIIAWLDKSYSPDDARWQVNHSLYAISSGGLFGKGLGQSFQKYLYVSEPQTDFIFAIVAEELGLIGVLFILILFALLVWRGIHIARYAPNRFSQLFVTGFMFQIALQVLLNIAVVTDTIPNTGIPLPFFSAGGTAQVLLFAQLGMVLGVSRQSSLKKGIEEKNPASKESDETPRRKRRRA